MAAAAATTMEQIPQQIDNVINISNSSSVCVNNNINDMDEVFHIDGVLEYILSFVTANDLIQSTTLVNRRWKIASRNDCLWEVLIDHLWKGKVGMNYSSILDDMDDIISSSSDKNQPSSSRRKKNKNIRIFWRTLYTQKTIQERMSNEQILSIFQHPLLVSKRSMLDKCGGGINGGDGDGSSPFSSHPSPPSESAEILHRTLQVHMLDVMSDTAATCTCCTPTITSSSSGSNSVTSNNSWTRHHHHNYARTTTAAVRGGNNYTSHETPANIGKSSSSSDSNSSSSDLSSPSSTSFKRWHTHFFEDIYYGSYVSSLLDSKRQIITNLELCTRYGFDMYFKISIDDGDIVADQTFLTLYQDDPTQRTFLYHHSTCYFSSNENTMKDGDDSDDDDNDGNGSNGNTFKIVLRQQNQQHHHPNNLQWRWLDIGRRLQVGPYPPLLVSRRSDDDWRWKLENIHVVLLFRDKV